MPEKDRSKNQVDNSENNPTEIPDPSPEFTKNDETIPERQPQSSEKIAHKPTREEPEPPIPGNPTHQIQPLTDKEARTWGMLAHLSILLNLISGFFGGIAAIIIYFLYKDRSRFVAYHAMQSFIFQSITWLGSGVIGGIFIAIGSTFGVLIIPLLCLIPGILILLLAPASVVYGIIGGIQVNNGEDFRYWQVGDWVRNILEPEHTHIP